MPLLCFSFCSVVLAWKRGTSAHETNTNRGPNKQQDKRNAVHVVSGGMGALFASNSSAFHYARSISWHSRTAFFFEEFGRVQKKRRVGNTGYGTWDMGWILGLLPRLFARLLSHQVHECKASLAKPSLDPEPSLVHPHICPAPDHLVERIQAWPCAPHLSILLLLLTLAESARVALHFPKLHTKILANSDPFQNTSNSQFGVNADEPWQRRGGLLQTGHHHHHLPATKDGHIRTPFMPLPHNLRSPPNINACSFSQMEILATRMSYPNWSQNVHNSIRAQGEDDDEETWPSYQNGCFNLGQICKGCSPVPQIKTKYCPTNPVPSKGYKQYNILVSITINAPKSQNSQVSIELCISKTLEMFVLTNWFLAKLHNNNIALNDDAHSYYWTT